MEYETLAPYDRLYGEMRDICMRLKPTTVQFVDGVGRAKTFIVEVLRHEKEVYVGDFIFVQQIDDKQAVTRLALPPAVTQAIIAQLAKLDKRSAERAKQRRSQIAKEQAKARMERGQMPAFLVPKKEKGTA